MRISGGVFSFPYFTPRNKFLFAVSPHFYERLKRPFFFFYLSYMWGRWWLFYNQSHPPVLPHPFYLTESRVPVEALPAPRRKWCDGVIIA